MARVHVERVGAPYSAPRRLAARKTRAAGPARATEKSSAASAPQPRGGRSTRDRTPLGAPRGIGVRSTAVTAAGAIERSAMSSAPPTCGDGGWNVRCAGPTEACKASSPKSGHDTTRVCKPARSEGTDAQERMRSMASSGDWRAGGGAMALAPRSSQSGAEAANALRANMHDRAMMPAKTSAHTPKACQRGIGLTRPGAIAGRIVDRAGALPQAMPSPSFTCRRSHKRCASSCDHRSSRLLRCSRDGRAPTRAVRARAIGARRHPWIRWRR